ncbi:MAG: DNA repair protein RadA [Candidatus Dojkabacteria bacterium]
MNYICTNCEATFLGWSGRCSNCGQWDTLVEYQSPAETSKSSKNSAFGGGSDSVGRELESASLKALFDYQSKGVSAKGRAKLGAELSNRINTGFSELDRVLGGGLVSGEVVLLSGEPGVGKSTLLSQIALEFAKRGKVLYVSGEESLAQLADRMKRLVAGAEVKGDKTLKIAFENLELTPERQVEVVAAKVREQNYELIIVDSIQAVVSEASRGYAGSISQVRACGSYLTFLAKQVGVPILMVGQVNKEGSVAGPKVLEHVVDCVIYIEGEEYNMYRVVRSVKNRYGATNEIGVFEMADGGLKEVLNPSEIFLNKDGAAVGSAISAVVMGSRVVMVEVQALVVERAGSAGPMRRVANGVKQPRLEMLVAVMSRFGKTFLGDRDVFVNVVGGVKVDDPIIDLAICSALKSSFLDKPLDAQSVYLGEVSLTGGLRSVYGINRIASECKRLGYKRLVVPEIDLKVAGIKLDKLKSVVSIV